MSRRIFARNATGRAVLVMAGHPAMDARFLRGALEQEKLVSGSESQYGLFITSADGETADDSKQQWWCVTKGGEQVNTGVDTTPIADGETYELTLKTGY